MFENLVKMQLYIKIWMQLHKEFGPNVHYLCSKKKYETTIAFTLPLMKIRWFFFLNPRSLIWFYFKKSQRKILIWFLNMRCNSRCFYSSSKKKIKKKLPLNQIFAVSRCVPYYTYITSSYLRKKENWNKCFMLKIDLTVYPIISCQ